MRNYIQINNVSKDEWSWFLQDNGHAALVRSKDNVSNSEPNLVPGLFYMFDVSEDAPVKVRYICTEQRCRLVLLDGV